MMRSAVTAALLLAAGAYAHFTVQYPATVGDFKDDDEDKSPCGGYSPDLASIDTVDFHVGGDAVATMSTHPQTTWLYRSLERRLDPDPRHRSAERSWQFLRRRRYSPVRVCWQEGHSEHCWLWNRRDTVPGKL